MSSDYNTTRRQRKLAADPDSLLTRTLGALIQPTEAGNLPSPTGEYTPAEPMPMSQSEPAEAVPVEEAEAAPDPPLCDLCLESASDSGAPFVTEEAA